MKGLLKKISLPKIHFSKKVVIIAVGVLVLLGASGGAALYFFADKVSGEEEAKKAIDPNGVACLDVQTEVIHKVDRFWIRKYISAEGDGPDRARTAMRVALAVQEKEKPDLVQVVVLDAKGPSKRADIRGRAIGANVLLISNPAKLPKDMPAAEFSARFIDGTAGPDGLFYGQKVDMLEEDVKALAASISTRDLCGDLTGGAAKGGEHGEAPAGGHEAPAEGGHGEAPAAGHDAPADGGHGASTGDEHASAEAPPSH